MPVGCDGRLILQYSKAAPWGAGIRPRGQVFWEVSKSAFRACLPNFDSFRQPKVIVMRLFFGTLVTLLFAGLASGAAAQDLFPDKNLEAVVRQYVFEKKNKPDPLVEADVVNISGIKADGNKVAKITNLAGLEKCKSLAAIELPNHEIADLAPLKELKQLQSVILNKNKIASVQPLADLT